MAVKAGENVRVYLDGYDISGYASKVSVGLKGGLTDVTTLNSAGHKHARTLADNIASVEGFYDEDGINIALEARRSSSGVLSIMDGESHGSVAVCGNAAMDDFSYDTVVDDVIKANASFKFNGLAGSGKVIGAKATHTADSNDTTVDDSAGTTAGGEAYLHVFSVSSADTIDVTLRHSTDNFSSSDVLLCTFTQASAITAEKVAFTGAVNRYVRAVYDVTGSDVSIVAAVQFVRN